MNVKKCQPYYTIKPDDEMPELRFKRIPYKRIASLLGEGFTVFIPCERRKASYIRKRLESIIGELIEAYPSTYKDMIGYTFKMSLVEQVIRYGIEKKDRENKG